jgi:hypothetical protein
LSLVQEVIDALVRIHCAAIRPVVLLADARSMCSRRLTLCGITAQNYVFMHMSACVGSAAQTMDWTHERTELSDEIR